MDDGETFVTAGMRESKEEAGVTFSNPRLIRIEQGHQRIRYVLHGEVDENAELKSKPDRESNGARWFTVEQTNLVRNRALAGVPECKLRGSEPLEFFSHVHSSGPSFPVDERISVRADFGAEEMQGRFAYDTMLSARIIVPMDNGVLVDKNGALPLAKAPLGTVGELAERLAASLGTQLVSIAIFYHHMRANGTADFGAVFLCEAVKNESQQSTREDFSAFRDSIDAQALQNFAHAKVLPLSVLQYSEGLA